METTNKGSRSPLDPHVSKVSLLDVDMNVSKVFAMARKRPITVFRYRSPYAVIVSHDTWVCTTKPSAIVPLRSPLVPLNDAIEHAQQTQAWSFGLTAVFPRLLLEPATIARALMLQVLYSIPTEATLHDQLTFNRAFRWFVGLHGETPVWDSGPFVQDLRTLLEDDRAVELLLELLQRAMPVITSPESDFKLNIALARAWALRHPRLDKRVPSQASHDGRLFLMPHPGPSVA
ncbi:transposase [Achromobacter pestifer]|uniref:Transposase InsH N-terminal domain-containing protein n=1 Tax=Achromobacter pestifer TaxID=1353889 RepID=A0A6S6ZGU0_9BURK|nr:transposase [Achromobacter pestifer]CAB3647330.1 hypothetical protein LMG3431_02559 [Achromobacter pestifer]